MDGILVRVGRRRGAALSDDAETAIAALVADYHAPLLRFLTRQTSDPELARDLAQETFLAAVRAYDNLVDPAAVAAWLFAIARNQLRMEWRRRRLRRIVSLDWLVGRGEPLNVALSRPHPSAPDDERDAIQRVLDRLTPSLRQALLLHDLCGFSGGEVAQILGISPDAARKRIVRAEALFRDYYAAGRGEAADDGIG